MSIGAHAQDASPSLRASDGLRIQKASSPVLFAGSIVVVFLALTFGGAARQGLLSDTVVELASLPLLVLAAHRLFAATPLMQEARWPLLLLCCAFALPVIQLLPLPPSIWTQLPGRATFVAVYEPAKIPMPWEQISLDPSATWRSLFAMLPAAATYLAILCLPSRSRRKLSLLVIAVSFAGFVLGLMQLAGGSGSVLRFYAITNPDNPVGFFANSNHFAALLYSTMPFIAAWAADFFYGKQPGRIVGLCLCLLIFVGILLGLGLTISRAGLLLAIASGAGSLALVWICGSAGRTRRAALGVLGAASLVGALLIVQFAFFGIVARTQQAVSKDLRVSIFATSGEAAKAFVPVGSGVGTFDQIYPLFEHPQDMTNEHINHAHNDWLELWLEGGALAALMLMGSVAWVARRGWQLWRTPRGMHRELDYALMRAGWIVIVLVLLHSVVDYPLRTIADMTLFALCAAFTASAPWTEEDDVPQRIQQPVKPGWMQRLAQTGLTQKTMRTSSQNRGNSSSNRSGRKRSARDSGRT